MPRFVILEHDHPFLHWDLMLETGGVLRTWRMAAPPRIGESIAATDIADHRKAYLDYEGGVSGGRGQVKRWDAGTYEMLQMAPDRFLIRMEGGHVSGAAELVRVRLDEWSFRLGETD